MLPTCAKEHMVNQDRFRQVIMSKLAAAAGAGVTRSRLAIASQLQSIASALQRDNGVDLVSAASRRTGLASELTSMHSASVAAGEQVRPCGGSVMRTIFCILDNGSCAH